LNDPKGHLRYHAKYFDVVEGKHIASVCGSDGRRAVALAVLKAETTVFDISEPQKKYALELAKAANVKIGYEVGDFCETDLSAYGEYFDCAYAEGGILHYFHDLDKFFSVLHRILKPKGKFIRMCAKATCGSICSRASVSWRQIATMAYTLGKICPIWKC